MARLPNPAAETTHSPSPTRSRARGAGAAATGSPLGPAAFLAGLDA